MIQVPYLDSTLGRMRVWNRGTQKFYSHYIWHQNTGHWPVWPDEVIHHLDGDILNDSFDNLQLMARGEHAALHNFGREYSAATRQKMSEAHRGENSCLHGMTGENHPRWIGDSAHISTKYNRHLNYPNLYPPLTEEERQELNAHNRERYKKKHISEEN